MEQIVAIVDAAVNVIAPMVRQAFNTVVAVVKVAWEIIKAVIKIAMEVILSTIVALLQLLTGDWRGAWQTMSKAGAEIWKAIVEMAKISGVS